MTSQRLHPFDSRARPTTMGGRLAWLLLFGIWIASPAWADGHEGGGKGEAQVKYRQTLMSGVGADMGGIGDIMKNGLVLPGHVEAHAAQLAASAKLIGPAFKERGSKEANDARSEIWTNWPGFEKAISDFENAARGLESAAASGEGVGAAVKTLGKSCGGCHKKFRKPKEDSYKNQ